MMGEEARAPALKGVTTIDLAVVDPALVGTESLNLASNE